MFNFIKKLFSDERSKRFRIGVRDGVWSLYYTVIGTVGVTVSTSLSNGTMPTIESVIASGKIGLTIGLAHLVRKYMTGPKEETK